MVVCMPCVDGVDEVYLMLVVVVAAAVDVEAAALRTFRISLRPLTSGRSTGTRRSKRPGRSSAESRMSARLVAA